MPIRRASAVLASMLLTTSGLCASPGEIVTPMRMSWEVSSAAAADRAEQVLRRHADSGLNAMMYMARLSYLGDFFLDEQGRVRMRGLIPQDKQHKHPLDSVEDFAGYASMAERYGIDVYLMEAFYDAERQKLEALGSYERAYVGGYTRYHPFGPSQAPAPLEEKYWLGQLLEAARFAAQLSRDHPAIKGFMFDAEMYGGGGLMWRNHSSFDDQTYAAVIREMRHRRIDLPRNLQLETIPIADRFFVLEEHHLLEAYFHLQESLVADLARRFRREIDAINPDFVLGFYPYLPSWHAHGWARGLTTQRAPVVLLSAFEYSSLHVPQTLGHVEQARQLNIPHRFLTGFMPHMGRHTPASLERNIRRSLDLAGAGVDGYWIFSTSPLTQSHPDHAPADQLAGPGKQEWWITAHPDQFWSAIARANARDQALAENQLYRPGILPPAGCQLLTANHHYPGPRTENATVTVRYSHPADFPFHLDPRRDKAFTDGSAAWKPLGKDQTLTLHIDLGKAYTLEKMFLLAGHHGETHYPIGGTLYVSTSVDGRDYYDLSVIEVEGGRKLSMPFSQEDYGYVVEAIGVEARYVRLQFLQTEPSPDFPNVDKRYKAFAMEELAIWGRDHE